MDPIQNGGAPDDKSKAPIAKADEAGKDTAGVKSENGGAKDSDNAKGKSISDIAGVENEGDADKGGKPNRDDDKPGAIKQLIDLKKENREMRAMISDEVIPTIKALQEQIKRGGSAADEARDELDDLADEYELKPDFVKKLAKAIENKSTKTIEKKYLADIKDIKDNDIKRTEATQNARISKAIDVEIDRVIKEYPQYAKIANPDVIRKMVMADKSNLSRSMDDIFEDVYGKAVKGSPSIEGYAGGSKNAPKESDYSDLNDETVDKVARSRKVGGKEFEDYQNDLLNRLNFRTKSRHAVN